jgi:hypothetical protein
VAAVRVGPRPGDEVPVPAEPRGWRDQEHPPEVAIEKTGESGQHAAIGLRVPGSCDLAV